MPTLMLTQRLWRRFGLAGRPTEQPDDPSTGLGNWTVVDVATRYGELALFVNQRTCLVAVTPLLPLRDAVLLFAVQVGTELERLGVARESIDAEQAAILKLCPGKNTDRSLLGTANHLAFDAQHFDQRVASPKELCDRLQAWLNETPHVRRTPSFAADAVAEIFATRH